ncbi:hypothetical protein U8527_01980 [Kordia algicida OT-1]|uniref:Uncharacterized protein n=1 Tax=Kordia algicida OT-1 TaxID=391587 RepID=A9DTG9_9FLAO|nr:hypothetical protein [Kordia algicida]EDP97072.1 hypothetical protein KAOT1_17953 [Kordia algicida OT-1]
MRNLKLITAFIVSFALFTSCQDEVDSENGQNPNPNVTTNTANSMTTLNLERASMFDGSFDDFLDDTSCSAILLPVTANVNGTQVTIVSESDYQLVLDIIGQFNTDDDDVEFQFPISVMLSDYTEVTVTNEAEYDALIDACEDAQNTAQDAISCVDIQFPMVILNYDASLNQTGSLTIQSEEELYNFVENLDDDESYSISYPITVILNDETTVTINSDSEFENSLEDCLDIEDMEDEANDNADTLEEILVEGTFRVESFIDAGVDTANTYADFTIDFANDLTVEAENTVDNTIEDVEGTYEVTSETEVFLTLNFSGNASFELLNQTWEVVSASETTISLQSTVNSAITLTFVQI